MIRETYLELLKSLFWGSLSGALLALSYQPYDFKILALISTFIWISYTIKNLGRQSESFLRYCLFIFAFLYVSRMIFYSDYLLVLQNKTTINPKLFPFYYILMGLQQIIITFPASILVYYFIKKYYHKLSRFFKLTGVLVAILSVEIISQRECPLSAFIALANLTENVVLFNFWGHDLTGFFYYLVFICFYFFSALKSFYKGLALIPLCVFLVLPYVHKTLQQSPSPVIKTIQVVIINEKLKIPSFNDPTPINLDEVIGKVQNLISSKNLTNSQIYYLWNEVAIIQNEKINVADHMKKRLSEKLPGKHFIGIFDFKTSADHSIKATSNYLYFDTLTGEEQNYQKKTLVPLDEIPYYYPYVFKDQIIKPIEVVPAEKMVVFTVDNLKIGISLCNEILDIRELINQKVYQSADVIINPSNVPLLYRNNFESLLDELSLWGYKISGVPILRISAANYVNWISDDPAKLNTKHQTIHALTINIPMRNNK